MYSVMNNKVRTDNHKLDIWLKQKKTKFKNQESIKIKDKIVGYLTDNFNIPYLARY